MCIAIKEIGYISLAKERIPEGADHSTWINKPRIMILMGCIKERG
jgi:hypothetical protein